MSFDNLTLTGLLVTLSYIVMLAMFRTTKFASRRHGTLLTERFINDAIRYRNRDDAIDTPCNPCI